MKLPQWIMWAWCLTVLPVQAGLLSQDVDLENKNMLNRLTVYSTEEVKALTTPQLVILEGHLIHDNDSEDFVLEDETGTIKVHIDDEAWRDRQVGAKDRVRLWGKTAGGTQQAVEIDGLDILSKSSK